MELEEFKSLKPGTKIIFTGISNWPFEKETYIDQEKNGGFFIVRNINSIYNDYYAELENYEWKLSCHHIELYKDLKMTNNEKAGYKQKICSLRHRIYKLEKDQGIKVSPYGLCNECGCELGLIIDGRYVSTVCWDAQKGNLCTYKDEKVTRLNDIVYKNLQAIVKQLHKGE